MVASIDQTTPGTTNKVSIGTDGTVTANQGEAGASPWPVKPQAGILELGLTEIIDKDDTEVSQNDYSKSVGIALGGSYSGVITQLALVASELGTGAVPARSGVLYVFDADPTVSSGDTALALADWQSCLGHVLISNWRSDASGGFASEECAIKFHAVSTLYFVFQNLGTAINDAAGDDEELAINGWYERWS
jgi:hypothetical protein